jgi:hypothetical protein
MADVRSKTLLMVLKNVCLQAAKVCGDVAPVVSLLQLLLGSSESQVTNNTSNISNLQNVTNNINVNSSNPTNNATIILGGLARDPAALQSALSLINILFGADPTVGAASAAVGLIKCILRYREGNEAAEALKHIDNSLSKIANILSEEFSFGDKFPQHIYDFTRTEIQRSQNKRQFLGNDAPREFFFIFHTATNWQPKFNTLVEKDPLPNEFCGYSSNLDVLCALIQHVFRPVFGPRAVFTILFPAESTFLIDEPISFPKEMGPLRLKGELRRGGVPYVYMNLYNLSQETKLDNVANIKPTSWREVVTVATAATVFHGTCTASAVGSILIFGAIPVVGVPFMFGSFILASTFAVIPLTSATEQAVGEADIWKVQPRLLGYHLEQESQNAA